MPPRPESPVEPPQHAGQHPGQGTAWKPSAGGETGEVANQGGLGPAIPEKNPGAKSIPPRHRPSRDHRNETSPRRYAVRRYAVRRGC